MNRYSSNKMKVDRDFDIDSKDVKKYIPHAVAVLIIALVNMPVVYENTQKLAAAVGLFDIIKDGRPTVLGVLIHAVVALALILASQKVLPKLL